MLNSKIRKQIHPVLDRWKVELTTLDTILWKDAHQIVRLKDIFWETIKKREWDISLFNKVSPINTDIIRAFNQSPWEYSWIKICKILNSYDAEEYLGAWYMHPIIDGNTIQTWNLKEMSNIKLTDIRDGDLHSSIMTAQWKTIGDVHALIDALAQDFYWDSSLSEEISIKWQLFFRKVSKLY